jgi:hypothetical protein
VLQGKHQQQQYQLLLQQNHSALLLPPRLPLLLWLQALQSFPRLLLLLQSVAGGH